MDFKCRDKKKIWVTSLSSWESGTKLIYLCYTSARDTHTKLPKTMSGAVDQRWTERELASGPTHQGCVHKKYTIFIQFYDSEIFFGIYFTSDF